MRKEMHGVLAKAAGDGIGDYARGCDDRDHGRTIDGDPGHRGEGKETLHGLPYFAADVE